MEHYEFKAAIPVDHLLHIVSIVRTSGVAGNVDDLLICLGSAMGELGTYIKSFEEPYGEVLSDADVAEVGNMTVEECCMMLETKIGDPETFGSPATIDPQTLLVIFQLAMKLFELFKSRR